MRAGSLRKLARLGGRRPLPLRDIILLHALPLHRSVGSADHSSQTEPWLRARDVFGTPPPWRARWLRIGPCLSRLLFTNPIWRMRCFSRTGTTAGLLASSRLQADCERLTATPLRVD